MILALALVSLALTGIGPMTQPHVVWVRQAGRYSTSLSASHSALYVISATASPLPTQVSKYDFNGNLIWAHEHSFPNTGFLYAIATAPNSFYLVGIEAYTGGFLEKYDFDGNILWQRHLGGGGESVSVGPNAVYVFGRGTANGDGFVAKFDFDGNEAWMHKFSVGFAAHVSAGQSGVYVVGQAYLVGYFAMAIDNDGNEIWSRSLPSAGAFAISASPTGVYVSGGILNSAGPYSIIDAYVRKYDFNGNEIWTRTLGFANSSTEIDGLDEDSSGVYAVENVVCFPCTSTSVFAVHLDPHGNEIWAVQIEVFFGAISISASPKGVFVAGSPLVVKVCASQACVKN